MVRIDGHDLTALCQREGSFWEVQSGRRPPPAVVQLLGGTLLWIDPDEGAVAMEFPGTPELANPNGIINGGLLATMLDMTMGRALFATFHADELPATVEMKVSYLRAAKVAMVRSEGRVIRKGRSIAFLIGELRDIDGELVATGVVSSGRTSACSGAAETTKVGNGSGVGTV